MRKRPGCLTVLARVLAGLAAAALILLLPVTLLTRNLALELFNPLALSQRVSEGLFQQGTLRQAVVDNVLGGEVEPGGIDLQGVTQYMTEQQRDALIDRLLPSSWVEGQVLRVATDFFAWFDSPATRLRLTLDMEPVRTQLRGEATGGLVEALVESWPACTLEDVNRMLGVGAIPGQEGFPFCEPPEPLRGLLVGTLASGLGMLAEAIPAELPVVDQDFAAADNLMQVKERVRMVQFASRWGILVSLMLLGVIMALAVRSWRDLVRWWGIPLLLGGLFSFLPVVLGGPVLKLLLAEMTAGMGSMPALASLVEALGRAMAAAVLSRQLTHAAIFTFAGLFLLLLGLMSRSRPGAGGATSSGDVPLSATPASLPDGQSPDRDRPSGMFG